MKLEDIRGLGSKAVGQLIEKNVKTAEQLAMMREEELQAITGWSWKKAHEVIQDALAKTLEVAVEMRLATETEKWIRERVLSISTGSSSLDKMLGNYGLRSDLVTMVYGEFATAKTQLGFQLLANCLAKNPEYRVAFVETEGGTFSPERIRQIRPTVGELEEGYLNRVFHIPANQIVTPAHQFLAYRRIARELEKGQLIKLIIVDSFTSKFRSYFQRREQLGDRTREFAKHVDFLDMLATKYHLAVYLTAQVMGVPLSFQEEMHTTGVKTETKFGLRGHKLWGGDYVTHAAGILVAMSRKDKTTWWAKVVDSPDLPENEAYFSIFPEGIRDCVGKRSG